MHTVLNWHTGQLCVMWVACGMLVVFMAAFIRSADLACCSSQQVGPDQAVSCPLGKQPQQPSVAGV